MSPADPITAGPLVSAGVVVAQHLGLVLARVAPLALLTPLFGGAAAPRGLRLGAAAILAAALAPALPWTSAPALDAAAFAMLAAKEALLGLTLAMFVRVLFAAFSALGSLADLFRGATLANALDPGSAPRPSPLSVFAVVFGVTMFLTAGGHIPVLTALRDSLTAAPPAEPMPPALAGPEPVLGVISLTAHVFTLAVRLAAPVLVLVLLLDLALGMLSRLAPPLNAYFVGLSLRGALTLLGLALFLAAAVQSNLGGLTDALGRWTASLPGPPPVPEGAP